MTESFSESSTAILSDSAVKKLIRVLHVDDDTSFLRVAKQIMEMQGTLQVENSSSVEEAMEKMRTTSYDVIVSDYQMSGKDGPQFLARARFAPIRGLKGSAFHPVRLPAQL
jgi:CheY-like chemotaxis protein